MQRSGESSSSEWAPPPRVESLAPTLTPELVLSPPAFTPAIDSSTASRLPPPVVASAEPSNWPAGSSAFVPVSDGELRDEGGWDEVREALQDAERSGGGGGAGLQLPPPPSSRFGAQLDEAQNSRLGRSISLKTPSSSQLDIPDTTPRRLSNPLPSAAALPFDPWAPTARPNQPLRTSSLTTLAAPFTPAPPTSSRQLPSTFQSSHPPPPIYTPHPPFDPHGAGFTPPRHAHLSAPSSPLFPDRQTFAPAYYDTQNDGTANQHHAQGMALSRGEYLGGESSVQQARWGAGSGGGGSGSSGVAGGLSRSSSGRGPTRTRRRSEGAGGMPRFGANGGASQPPLSFAASRGPLQRNPPPPLYHFPPDHHRTLPPRLANPPYTPPATGSAKSFSLSPQHSAPQLRSTLPERTNHAMWMGNVPPDATEAELWAFFLSRSRLPNSDGSPGVQSVHLIARSQCAFVNLSTEDHLHHIISQSHGVLLRPNDPKCKPLVCRVRRVEDDKKSGVGAQRGGGLHKAWVEERREIGEELEEVRKEGGGAESTETSSTDSEFLSEHFSKRFFILKSHNQFDLEQSAKTGWWATQPHNEAVLDQAYRTASEGVFLIFSANKSGSWAGFARMMSPIFPEHDHPPKGATTSPPKPPLIGFPAETSPAPRRPFQVQWLSTAGVSFSRTRHITNSFNAKREVKICRDGTEVEPFAGEMLLEELARAIQPPPARRPPSPIGMGFFVQPQPLPVYPPPGF
ncbi:YT521-B-like domain-domain-containing protein [Leucosporidium creatinivorum]|uniref:YT521-B-like domain-domain-containing protein n=1 Tax=Leucosporidium creatinivorum TaxID=106004 RepID=A0A1Y2FBD3_9BASI|nr:YT521-B-like domain-domain-containing protein [Leucosporidium creatinivorum]